MIKKEKHDAFERATLATAIAGVAILCIYTALTGYQAYIAKDTAQRQLRAYISVRVEKQPDMDGPSPPQAVILYKNNGQTPAYNVDARANFFTGGEQLTDTDLKDTRALLAKMRNSESVLFPGQEFRESPEPGTGIPLSKDQKIAVSMGSLVLWLVGEVKYIDAFGSPRFTRFRLYMGGTDAAPVSHVRLD
jgi:hypothetical protein